MPDLCECSGIPCTVESAGVSCQTLHNIAIYTWVGNCLTFSYADNLVPPAGNYTGRATYTLSAP